MKPSKHFHSNAKTNHSKFQLAFDKVLIYQDKQFDLPLRNASECFFAEKLQITFQFTWLSQSNYHMAAGTEE